MFFQLIISRRFSLSSSRRNLGRILFEHFQFARRAKQFFDERQINLTNKGKRQLFNLQIALRSVHISLSLFSILFVTIWYRQRRQNQRLIDEEFHPTFIKMKNFRSNGIIIKDYLLPEQILHRLIELKSMKFCENDFVCVSFPKSGTTLLQEILYLLLTDFDYQSAKKVDLSERFTYLEWPIIKKQLHQTRFFKTHLPRKFFNETFSKCKVKTKQKSIHVQNKYTTGK